MCMLSTPNVLARTMLANEVKIEVLSIMSVLGPFLPLRLHVVAFKGRRKKILVIVSKITTPYGIFRFDA